MRRAVAEHGKPQPMSRMHPQGGLIAMIKTVSPGTYRHPGEAPLPPYAA